MIRNQNNLYVFGSYKVHKQNSQNRSKVTYVWGKENISLDKNYII